MRQAAAAKGILPLISGKPAEFCCRLSLHETAGCLPETTDLKGNACRIEKGMFMAFLPADSLSRIGNRSITGTAAQSFPVPALRFVVCPGVQAAFRSGLRGGTAQQKIRPDRNSWNSRSNSGQQWRSPYPEWYSYLAGHQRAGRFF